MPEPGYANGEPAGCLVMIVGTIAVALLFVVIKSCIWAG